MQCNIHRRSPSSSLVFYKNRNSFRKHSNELSLIFTLERNMKSIRFLLLMIIVLQLFDQSSGNPLTHISTVNGVPAVHQLTRSKQAFRPAPKPIGGRFRRCAPACQPHHCCRKSHCVCVHDYWGPVCYCEK